MAKTSVPQVLLVKRSKIRAFEGQPRKYFDPAKRKELGESIKEHGQRIPATAIRLDPPINGKEFELVGGERRWQACEEAGVDDFLIILDLNIKNDNEQYLMAVIDNYFREPPTIMETAHSIAKLKTMGFNEEQIGKKMGGKSAAWTYQHVSLLRLHPEIQKLVDPPTPEKNRIPFNTALMLVKLPHELQLVEGRRISVEGLSMVKADQNIIKAAEKAGIAHTLKIPRTEFKKLSNFITKTGERVEAIIDRPEERIAEAMKAGDKEGCKLLLRNLDDLISSLKVLKGTLEEADSKTA